MVRFTCFASPIHHYKSKKSVQRSYEAMDKNSQDSSQDRAPKVSCSSSSSNPFKSKAHDNNPSNTSAEQITSSPSIECIWKSDEMNSSEDNKEVLQTVCLKKSQSLGSGLDREGQVPFDVQENEMYQDQLCDDDSHKKNFNRMFDAFDHNESEELFLHQDSETYLLNQYMKPMHIESLQTNDDLVHAESIFSVGDPEQIEIEVQEDFGMQLSAKQAGHSEYHTFEAPARIGKIMKSCSLPDLKIFSATPGGENLAAHGFLGPRSKSFEGLSAIDAIRREMFSHGDVSGSKFTFCKSKGASMSQTSHFLGTGSLYQEASQEDCVLFNPSVGSYEVGCQERDHIFGNEQHTCENQFDDRCASFNFTGFVMEWPLSEIDEVDVRNNPQQESSVDKWDGLSDKEFNSKRIEDWINRIDLHNNNTFYEVGECSSSTPKTRRESSLAGGVIPAKLDARITPGMEVANRYISSLTALSTSAQMANLGLTVIPFMSAYVSLRVLNLSGNAIVRITAGALPRGLHLLNLSRNNISTIEGLRELTRLRVLDLSCNRIFRIGHGLASCSSLKELYLAGNKISEVEGLHRLLKLSFLDLRLNKISTAKCLGQLAANYGSLQAINLEGNPAQRNVGDELLKKHLVGLLPHLVYFNRQIIRNSSLKEIADRPGRSVTAYQFDHGLRSEQKLGRRGNHGASTQKSASSSTHLRSSQMVGSSMLSKGRHGRVPPSRLRGTHQQADFGSTKLNLRINHSMHRSRSEGTL